MAKEKKSTGLLAAIDSEILHAIGLGALLATVSIGIGMVAGTVTVAGTTAAIAMGIGAVVGIGAMAASIVSGRKAKQATPEHPPVVIIQAQGQGIVHAPEIEQSANIAHGKFTQKILDERAQQTGLAR